MSVLPAWIMTALSAGLGCSALLAYTCSNYAPESSVTKMLSRYHLPDYMFHVYLLQMCLALTGALRAVIFSEG
eukprot:gene11947-20237_t